MIPTDSESKQDSRSGTQQVSSLAFASKAVLLKLRVRTQLVGPDLVSGGSRKVGSRGVAKEGLSIIGKAISCGA